MKQGCHKGAVPEKPPVMLDVLGMIITEADRTPALGSGMEEVEELVVLVVGWGGTADTAGVETGDIITAVDGKPTRSLWELEVCLSAHLPQTPIVFQLRRAGTRCQVAIPFEESFAGGIHKMDSLLCSISRIKSLTG